MREACFIALHLEKLKGIKYILLPLNENKGWKIDLRRENTPLELLRTIKTELKTTQTT